MPISLSKVHRKLLENTTAAARVLAESACNAALENLAVHEKDYRAHMTVEQRLLRNRLRARGRALGDKRDERTGIQGIYHLTQLAAYEHWHRLLFTRFLTENNLLITDEANGSVPTTLQECEELAPDLGARDGFDLACRFASLTLPGVFRRDDPVLDLPVALNDQVELRKLLGTLSSECFQADDSLGWTYQFWQAKRKKEIDDSRKKIGADELSPVTQLFTEDYMVEFLLHNTIGAWWAGKIGPIQAASEEEARAHASLSARDCVPAVAWTYLRFVQNEATKNWLPAAGTFDGWPKAVNLIQLLDPCMGSGHFLVFALPLLVRLRMEEEQIAPKAAVVAVINDNIHGLELDERCTQIAAFNVALTAWKLAGHQALPSLHLACSGLAPSATEAEWVTLAGDEDRLRRGMLRLYHLFKDAPVLGSLIDPRVQGGNLIEADFHELNPLLKAVFSRNEAQKSAQQDDSIEFGVIAQGLAKAAEMLARQFTLVATNVPYLGRGKQVDTLKDYCERAHSAAKADLATCFVERCISFCSSGGSVCLVTPQNWFFLSTYKGVRGSVLKSSTLQFAVRLGPNAFQDMNWWAATTAMLIASSEPPADSQDVHGVDVSTHKDQDEKAKLLRGESVEGYFCEISSGPQSDMMNDSDALIVFRHTAKAQSLDQQASSNTGLQTGDNEHYSFLFWELPKLGIGWEWFHRTSEYTCPYSGRIRILRWENGVGALANEPGSVIRGLDCRGRVGVLVHRMNELHVTVYTGEIFDQNGATIIPTDPEVLPALWTFLSSSDYHREVRVLDSKTGVTPNTLVKVPFDLAHWRSVAAQKYPNGLPKPYSDDPTQWLFSGHPKGSDQPLHVAISRLLGYAWPRQTGSSFFDCCALGLDGLESFVDSDGIVCLPPVNHEQPAVNRLRSLLAAAMGTFDERSLVAAAGPKGSKSKTLEDWLRDEFFEQHAKLFHDRPFIWHLWDGLSDGFHALVNYHKLDHANLQKLTYSYLGDWIQQQAIDANADKPGAAARLGSARTLQKKLAAILEGEAPLDIFVRWKPIKDQALGWHPDLNDGIRQNIRPFLLAGDVGKRGAGIFRAVPLNLKDDDRGTEPARPKAEYPWFWCKEEPGTDPVGGKEFVGTRWNDVHLTLGMKRGAKA